MFEIYKPGGNGRLAGPTVAGLASRLSFILLQDLLSTTPNGAELYDPLEGLIILAE